MLSNAQQCSGMLSNAQQSLTVGLCATQAYRPRPKWPTMNFFRSDERFGIIDERVSIFQKSPRAKGGKNAVEN